MMKTTKFFPCWSWLGIMIAALAGGCTGAVAQDSGHPNGSLWNQNSRPLAGDVRALRVGDTITVNVQESATASSTANTSTSRADGVNFAGISGGLHGLLSPFGTSANTSTNGQGTTGRSGSLITNITVVVTEVMPNGNLVVEGSRFVGVNAEKQKITVSGIVRPQDIGPNNSVSSVSLANASIHYDGKGPVGDKQRRGLLTTLFGWLF